MVFTNTACIHPTSIIATLVTNYIILTFVILTTGETHTTYSNSISVDFYSTHFKYRWKNLDRGSHFPRSSLDAKNTSKYSYHYS